MNVLLDVTYGNYDRNKLDAYLVNGPKPSPALIYLHGGGYKIGDKSAKPEIMDPCLAAGISYVSANYRFITDSPFPAPMEDGTRIIQFVRHMANEWNLDPNRIVVAGSSAGAHIALWNALKGDLSNPDSPDPVERCSSAVSCAICFNGQASKDQHFYDNIYFGNHIQPNLRLFYGVDENEDLESAKVRKLSFEASAINFVSENAPPVLMTYNTPFTTPIIPADAPVGAVIHHPIHGYILKQRMKQAGRTCVFRHTADPLEETELVRFMTNSFQLSTEQ